MVDNGEPPVVSDEGFPCGGGSPMTERLRQEVPGGQASADEPFAEMRQSETVRQGKETDSVREGKRNG
jgi:hypothetical protein